MRISKKIQDELNMQINKEFYSAYLYLAMATYCSSTGFEGFANWLKIQSQEELEHGMKIYHYILERGGNVEFDNIEQPDDTWTNLTNIFEEAYNHEKFITDNINHIIEVAGEEKDFETTVFLNWFANEQVEEEATTEGIVKKLQYGANEKTAIMLLDKELGKRKTA